MECGAGVGLAIGAKGELMTIAMNAPVLRAPSQALTTESEGELVVRAPLYCDWPVGTRTYTELMALHLTLELHRSPLAQLLPAISPMMAVSGLSEADFTTLKSAFTAARLAGPKLMQGSDGTTVPAIGLRLLGDGLEGMPEPLPVPARWNVGVVQTCDTRIDAEALARVAHMDLLLAGSSWMRDVLVRAGAANVDVLPTGIDTTLFAPGPKSGHLSQRFVIFSGGRLDYRKGQDIVVAAVKIFCQRHPETLLLTTWQSPLPETAGSIVRSGHTPVAPEYYGTTLNVHDWAVANGLRAESVADLGVLAPAALAVVLREADVALFPNRAETDMNPMVLECMASGVPVIVSENTGHLDVAAELCHRLTQQAALRGVRADAGTEGWGESSEEEIVAHLETIFMQRAAARVKAAAEWAKQFAWDRTGRRLMELIAPVK